MKESNLMNFHNNKSKETLSGPWMKILLLLVIPGVNFIIMIFWALNDKVDTKKRNLIRDNLLLIVLVGIIYTLLVTLLIFWAIYR